MIADYMFAHPEVGFVGAVSYFVGKMSKSKRTIERYVVDAEKIVGERRKIQEKAKEEAIAKAAKEEIKKGIISRMEAMQILSDIAKGKVREIKVKGKTVFAWPKENERIAAVEKLAEFNGWKSSVKIENKIVYPTKINIIKDNGRNE